MISSLIISLLLTITLELLFSYCLGIRRICDIKIVIFVNICTNPIVVFLSNIILILDSKILYYIAIFILEIGAITIEALLYKRYLKKKVNFIKLSIYNNTFSFFIGLILKGVIL